MKKLVLVIDDSHTVQKILQVCLEREAYQVIACSNGVEALKYLREPTNPVPNLIFVDIHMPHLDGFETVKRLRQNRRLAKSVILMLSRSDSIIDRLKGRLAGAQDLLSKPFKTAHIVATVQRYIGDAELEAETTHTYTSLVIASRF